MTKYEIKYTTQFKKDYKLAKCCKLNLSLLKDIICELANGTPLEPQYEIMHYQVTGLDTENVIFNQTGF